MTEREKVKAGLECLTHVNFAIYKKECQERNCPYKDAEQCDSDVMVDALNLLEKLDVEPEELERLKKCRHECKIDCLREHYEQALEKAKAYDHLLHLAKAMHTWIFLNTFDEQAVYDKLGFTDEDNALLGSIGRPMVIGRVRQEDSDGMDA